MKGRVERWLRNAYGPQAGCPPAEAFLPSELRAVPEEERRRLEDHATACPACSAERDLARAFEAPPGDIAERREDVEHIVARLDARPRPRHRLPVWWGFAAAAVLIGVAVGVVGVRRSTAPPLPVREGGGTILRGSRVELLHPVGELDELPGELRWESVPDAAGYRVRVFEVGDTLLHEATTHDTRLELPAHLRRSMHRAVRYTWEVVAVDEGGARIAASERGSFRTKPAAGN